jgi:hypothetical protein
MSNRDTSYPARPNLSNGFVGAEGSRNNPIQLLSEKIGKLQNECDYHEVSEVVGTRRVGKTSVINYALDHKDLPENSLIFISPESTIQDIWSSLDKRGRAKYTLETGPEVKNKEGELLERKEELRVIQEYANDSSEKPSALDTLITLIDKFEFEKSTMVVLDAKELPVINQILVDEFKMKKALVILENAAKSTTSRWRGNSDRMCPPVRVGAPVHIPPLFREEAIQLICGNPDGRPGYCLQSGSDGENCNRARSKILKKVGYHPGLLKSVCAVLFEYQTSSPKITNPLDYVERCLHNLDLDEEVKLLIQVAKKFKSKDYEDLLRWIFSGEQLTKETRTELSNLGLIIEDDKGTWIPCVIRDYIQTHEKNDPSSPWYEPENDESYNEIWEWLENSDNRREVLNISRHKLKEVRTREDLWLVIGRVLRNGECFTKSDLTSITSDLRIDATGTRGQIAKRIHETMRSRDRGIFYLFEAMSYVKDTE